MTKKIYPVVGVPGSGKTWVLNQLIGKYTIVRNDSHIGSNYVAAIINAASKSEKPILCDVPFSVSSIIDPLLDRGYEVKPCFVVASEETLNDRWDKRKTEEKARRGHLTRQETFRQRAKEWGAFCGESQDVVDRLLAQSFIEEHIT